MGRKHKISDEPAGPALDGFLSHHLLMPELPYSRDLISAVGLIEKIRTLTDGHFTLMAWTTGWKAMAWTPNLDTSQGRWQVHDVPMSPTPALAIARAVAAYVSGEDRAWRDARDQTHDFFQKGVPFDE